MKPRLLFVGVSPQAIHSGQGRVSQGLTQYWVQDYDTHIAGWGCVNETSTQGCMTIHCNSEKWWEVIDEVNPDILFLSHDVWRFPQLPDVRKSFPNIKIVGYFTIDADPLAKDWLPSLNACDVIVTPSVWGANVILERFTSKPVLTIHNGLDLDIWKLNILKDDAKLQVDTAISNLENVKSVVYLKDKFIILFCGTNYDKKNLSALMDAYTRFCFTVDDTFLFIVTHNNFSNIYGQDVMRGCNFSDTYAWCGIKDKYRVVDKVFTDTELARIYSISDCVVMPTMGEGFGLPVIEAMASDSMPIISNYSACVELAPNFIPINISAFQRVAWNAKRSIVSSLDIYNALYQAYNIWKNNRGEWYKLISENKVVVDKFSWGRSAASFNILFKSVINNDFMYNLDLRRL